MVDLSTSHQHSMSRPRPAAPHTPPRSPTQERDEGDENADGSASVTFTINIPANLAADTDISVVVTPRSSRISRARTLPQIAPLRFQPAASASPRPATPIAPLRFQPAASGPRFPATPSPSPSPVRQRTHQREPVILDSTDPIYPRPPGSVHPNDPVPNVPTRSRKFYCVFKGSKIGVFWDSWPYVASISKDIGGQWRKADTYEQAVDKWDSTDMSQREIFTAD